MIRNDIAHLNTYFRDVRLEEFQKFLAQIYRLSFETSLRIMAELPKGDPEVMLNIYLNYHISDVRYICEDIG